MINLFAKIKNYALLALGGLAAVLFAMLKYQSSRADKANERANIAESKVTSADKRIEAHEKRDEIEQDIAIGDVPYIDERLRDPYDRDESTKL